MVEDPEQLQDFIRSAKVATRGWLLQGRSEDDRDGEWGRGILGEGTAEDREADGQEQDLISTRVFHLQSFIRSPLSLLQVLSFFLPQVFQLFLLMSPTTFTFQQ